VIIIIVITKFVGRREELDLLETRWASPGFEFVPIYGRRRIGKTELLLQFLAGKKAVYYQATTGTSKENLSRFREEAGRLADLASVREDWETTINHLASSVQGRFALAIDEFPHLVEGEPAISSTLQRLIDGPLKTSKMFLVLAGSSIGMMLREVMEARAPLYGRRTGQIDLRPLPFADAAELVGRPIEEALMARAICGGVPAYLRLLAGRTGFWEAVRRAAIARDAPLREEVPFLLRQDLRDPKVYMAILAAIAQGLASLGEIVDYAGLGSKTGVTPYLQSLAALGYVKRGVPVTENERSKKGIYVIQDPFIRFWFRFVRPQASLLERDPERVLSSIKTGIDGFMGQAFEETCRELAWTAPGLPPFDRAGRWWHGGEEIDLVAMDAAGSRIVFGECKWSKRVDPKRALDDLRRKAPLVRWRNDRREEHYAVFARGFVSTVTEEGVHLYDSRSIERMARSRGRRAVGRRTVRTANRQ
jgi:hypothetical protein